MGGIDSTVNANSEIKTYNEEAVIKVPLRKKPSVDELVRGISEGSRVLLSKAITLIESNAPKDFDKAQRVLQGLLPQTGRALRIGITGVPGAGKSTFIEAFGQLLCHMGYHVAVLAVDPTSPLTGGSIWGIRRECRTCRGNQTASSGRPLPREPWAGSPGKAEKR